MPARANPFNYVRPPMMRGAMRAQWTVLAARSRPRRMPGPRRRATKDRFLRGRWRGGPNVLATRWAIRPRRLDRRAGEKPGREDFLFDGNATKAGSNDRHGDRCRRGFAGLVFVPKLHREPSLDTPNTRPFSASSQGPKLAHRKPLTDPIPPHLEEIRPVVDRASPLILFFARHPVTFQMFTKISSIYKAFYPLYGLFPFFAGDHDDEISPDGRKKPQNRQSRANRCRLNSGWRRRLCRDRGDGGSRRPDNLGLHGRTRWQQSVDVPPLGPGGHHCGLRRPDDRRAVGGTSQNGRRLRVPLRSLRSVAGVFIRLGVIFHRVCRSECGVGIPLSPNIP